MRLNFEVLYKIAILTFLHILLEEVNFQTSVTMIRPLLELYPNTYVLLPVLTNIIKFGLFEMRFFSFKHFLMRFFI